MLTLFDKLPSEKFFSVLTGVHKEVYVDALFLLKDAFDKSEVAFYRKEYIEMLKIHLGDKLRDEDFAQEAEEEGEETVNVKEISQKAYFICRRFQNLGWIDVDYDAVKNDDVILVPSYSMSIMEALFSIASDKRLQYNCHVYDIYANLSKAKDTQKDYAVALKNAKENTDKLVRELKLLLSSIKQYCQKITDEADIKDMLHEHLVDYKQKVADKLIYPLKTYDSIKIFKTDIIRILNEWDENNEILLDIAKANVDVKADKDISEARIEAITTIDSIKRAFRNLDALMDRISEKNAEYSKITLDRIDYKLSSNQSIKGMILSILDRLKDKNVVSAMVDNVNAYSVELPDDESVVIKAKREETVKSEPIKVKKKKASSDALAAFRKNVNNTFSNKEIDEFMDKCFAGRDEFYTEDVHLSDMREFELLVRASIRAYEMKAPYKVKFFGEYIEVEGWGIPKAVFRRGKCLKRS